MLSRTFPSNCKETEVIQNAFKAHNTHEYYLYPAKEWLTPATVPTDDPGLKGPFMRYYERNGIQKHLRLTEERSDTVDLTDIVCFVSIPQMRIDATLLQFLNG